MAELTDKIPTAVVGLLGQIYSSRYSHAEIDSLFIFAGAPEASIEGSKVTKVQAWLRLTNAESPRPLEVLGTILDDFMEKQLDPSWQWASGGRQQIQRLEDDKVRIRETLARFGLSYRDGGVVSKGRSTATVSLDESVRKHGLSSVEVEIKRALSLIEQDPHAAAQYAGNVLEATLKAYLDHKQVSYKSGHALHELWKLASVQIGLKTADLDNNDLRNIASGLHSIVDGIAHLRNTKSGAHGKSEEQRQAIVIKPRHARLAIHSAHTVAAYVLELIDQ